LEAEADIGVGVEVIGDRITSDIGPLAKVKEDLTQAGVTQFGSGWCWLAVKDGKIVTMKTPNGENPLVHGAKPILGCDVWEHSYYIDYRNPTAGLISRPFLKSPGQLGLRRRKVRSGDEVATVIAMRANKRGLRPLVAIDSVPPAVHPIRLDGGT
jgi:hypothetical protein